MKKPELQFRLTVGKTIRIYINETLHLAIRRTTFRGFTSWIMHGQYHIEFLTAGGKIHCGYDRRVKWEGVLKLLDRDDLFTYGEPQ